MKDESKFIIALFAPLIVALWIYFIFAICLGFNPVLWDEGWKNGFIALSIVAPGFVFIVAMAIVFNKND